MASEGVRNIARRTARVMGKASGVAVPFSVSSSLGKRSRVEELDEALAIYMSPPKKPMSLPGASTRPSPRCRRPEYDHNRLKLRSNSVLKHKDPRSSSSRTIAEELEAFFNPAATSQQSRPTTQPHAQAPRARAINIPHSRRSPPREHVQREMTNPRIPAISEEDIAEMKALISPRSKKRGAAEALEGPSTPTTNAASSQPGKRQHTSSTASSSTTPSLASKSSQSSWSPQSMPSSGKKMEALAYQRSLRRQRSLTRGSADADMGSAGVVQWMDGLRSSRSRLGTTCLRREVHTATILQHLPRTTARFNHWLYLLSDQNLDLYTPQDLLVFILPLYLEIFLLSLTYYYRPPGFPPNPNRGGAHDYHTSIIIFFSCVSWVFTAIEHVWMQPDLPGMCLAVVDVCVEYLCVIMLQKVMLFGIAVLANWIFGWRAVRDAFWGVVFGEGNVG
ncbi:MAG: hypothetical protein L6R35_001425 [Caloplaca aegaea]|nr:MAG: hypothetical protein L6R35_001425 [Caloplaca aegaea]